MYITTHWHSFIVVGILRCPMFLYACARGKSHKYCRHILSIQILNLHTSIESMNADLAAAFLLLYIFMFIIVLYSIVLRWWWHQNSRTQCAQNTKESYVKHAQFDRLTEQSRVKYVYTNVLHVFFVVFATKKNVEKCQSTLRMYGNVCVFRIYTLI